MPRETHRQWLRKFILPSALLTAVVVGWSGVVGFLVYRTLGVTMYDGNGQLEVIVFSLIRYALVCNEWAILLQCLIFLILLAGRIHFRLWLVVLLLFIVGTPIAVWSGWRIGDYLWSRQMHGIAWEGFLPQAIGVAVAWLLSIPLSMWLSRYRIIVIRKDDARKSPCPRCGYELYGSSGKCPECGWVVPSLHLNHHA